MWLLIDNYDSFTEILSHYFIPYHPIEIIQNDTHSLEQIIALQPQRIIIGPGPKSPSEAGVVMEVIHYFADKIPILGICLGHQALGLYLGAKVKKAILPVHGKTSIIQTTLHHFLFENLVKPIEVMRYHSLIVSDFEHLEKMIPLAFTDKGELMAFCSQNDMIVGMQFHPESVLTPEGGRMIRNWINQDIKNDPI